jgi:hypothetical protein
MNNFDILSGHISEQVFEENILKKITYNFNSDNWRMKCQAVDLISKILQNPSFLNDKAIAMIMELAHDKVDAVRKAVINLIVEVIRKQSKDWCDAQLIPHLAKMKDNKNYLHRQSLIPIIEVLFKLF